MRRVLALAALMKIAFSIIEEDFIAFTSEIIKNVFDTTECLFYVTRPNYDLNLVYRAINKLNVSLVRITFSYSADMVCNGYILISRNYKDLTDILLIGTKYKLKFKANSRILIFPQKEVKLEKYYELNSNLYACDIFVVAGYPIYFNKNTQLNIKMVSVRNKSSVMSWNINETSSLTKDSRRVQTKEWDPNLLNGKLVVSMFNCSPYIYYDQLTKRFEGIEADILTETLKNVSFEYKIYNPNASIPNVYDAMVNDVAQRYSNLAMCSPWLDGRHIGKVEISFPYTQQCITFFVPRRHTLEQSIFVFKPITLQLGLGIVISAISVTIIYLLIVRYQIRFGIGHRHFKHVWAVLFELLRILTLRQAAKTFLTIHDVTRLVVVCWTIFSLLLATIYSSGISTYMTYPPLIGGVFSFEDIAEKNIEWGGLGEDNIAIFTEHPNPIFRKIAKLYSKNVTDSVVNMKLRKGENVAIFIKTLPSKYIQSEDLEKLDGSNLSRIKMLPKCAVLYLVGFYLSENSPLTNYLNKYLMRYLEHGIINYWYMKMNSKSGILKRSTILHNIYSANEFSNSQIVLQLEELQGVFVLLLCGWTAAAIAFICEILYWKYKNQQPC